MTRDTAYCRFCGAATTSQTGVCEAHRPLLLEDYRYTEPDQWRELRGRSRPKPLVRSETACKQSR